LGCGGVGIESFHDLRRRSRYGAKHFGVGADVELKDETPSIPAIYR